MGGLCARPSLARIGRASGARRVDTAAKQVHVPRLTNFGVADWYAELEEIGPGDPAGDDLVLTPYKCAATTKLSNEVVADSNPSVLDTVGGAMVRAISLEADRALFEGGGGGTIGPDGFVNASPALQKVTAAGGTITYANVVEAGGSISAWGGRADSVYLNPTDYTRLQLSTAGDDRPLIQPDASQGGAATIAGLRVYPTLAVRSDASVTFRTDAAFTQDATVVKVVARIDGAISDAHGVCEIS